MEAVDRSAADNSHRCIAGFCHPFHSIIEYDDGPLVH